MTLIAVAIPVVRPDGVSRALEHARDAKAHGADLVEWRVDSLVECEGGVRAAIRLIEQSPMPCIATIRDESEGGAYCGSSEYRLETWRVFAKASPPPAYIDIELSALRESAANREFLAELCKAGAAHEGAPRVILSYHDFKGRAPGLSGKVAELWADECAAIAKVAWTARTERDNTEAFEFLRLRAKPTVALCMGEHGLMSRVLSKKFGGFLTYARIDDQGTAPGQPTVHELRDLWRFSSIDAATRVFAVIGHPVTHSRSPALHNAWFGVAGVNARLFAVSAAPMWEAFKATLGELLACEGLDFSGAAITAPHKVHAIRYLEESGGSIDEVALRIGAVNTIVRRKDGSLHGLNTDAAAIAEVVRAEFAKAGRRNLKGVRALVLGAGGAARAAAAGLTDAGAIVTLLNRTPRHAKQVAEALSRPGHEIHTTTAAHVSKESFDLIANCTTVGMQGGPDPEGDALPLGVALGTSTVVFDAVYAPEETPLIKRARAAGARTIGGLAMFHAQAAAQFKEWTGKRAPEAVPPFQSHETSR